MVVDSKAPFDKPGDPREHAAVYAGPSYRRSNGGERAVRRPRQRGRRPKGLPETVYWPAQLTVMFQPLFPPEGKDLFWFTEPMLEQHQAKVVRRGNVLTIDRMDGVDFEAERFGSPFALSRAKIGR